MHTLGVRIPAAGVLHPEATSAPFTQVGDAVAGHAREVFDNCFTTANEPVNHGGLTNIRSSHNGHGRKSFFLLVTHAKRRESVLQFFPVGIVVDLAGFGALDGFGDDRLVVSDRAVDELVCAGVATCGARRVFALHVCDQVSGGVVLGVLGVTLIVLEGALELLVVDIVPVHGGPRVASLNDIEDVFHDLFNVHLRGIQNERILGWLQRRGRTVAVEFVAADDVGKHGVEVGLTTSSDVLVVAAASADLCGGGHEDLRRDVRENDRADVAAFHHTAHSRCGQRTLECDQVGAHSRNRGDRRHVAGDLRAANLAGNILTVEEDGGGVRVIGDFQRQGGRRLGHGFLVGRVDALAQHPQGGNAVHSAGVQVLCTQLGCDHPGDSRLASAGRAVDGNQQHVVSVLLAHVGSFSSLVFFVLLH